MIDEKIDGMTIPAIGLGTMRQHGEHCRSLVEAALAAGYRHLDTARKYGNEEDVGAGLQRSAVHRDDVLVTTKLTQLELEPSQVRSATQQSLQRLGTDHVDLLLIHWPSPDVPLEDTLGALMQLRDEGLTRFVGVANFPSTMLSRAVELADVATNQVEFHPYLAQQRVLATCRDNGVVLTAYCPLGRGNLVDDPVLGEIAAAHSRTAAQVALRWLVQQPGVVAIPGTSSPDHLGENLAVHDFALSDDEMEAIAALERGERVVNPDHAPQWD